MSRTLEASLGSLGHAGLFVEHYLCRRHATHAADQTAILATELMVRAVQQGGGLLTLSLHCDGSAVQVSVTVHQDPGMPSAPRATPNEVEAGREPIERVAHDWGVEPTEKGPRFWGTIRPGEPRPVRA